MTTAEWSLAFLAVMTLAQVLIHIDGWVHRRERKEAALEYQQSGRASLQAQIDAACASLVAAQAAADRQHAADEAMRLERASILAKELADFHLTLVRMGEKASAAGTQQQVAIGRAEGRLSAAEQRIEALEDRRGRPR